MLDFTYYDVLINHLYSCSVHAKCVLDMQGAAVTLAELGEYTRAASLLEDLTKVWLLF